MRRINSGCGFFSLLRTITSSRQYLRVFGRRHLCRTHRSPCSPWPASPKRLRASQIPQWAKSACPLSKRTISPLSQIRALVRARPACCRLGSGVHDDETGQQTRQVPAHVGLGRRLAPSVPASLRRLATSSIVVLSITWMGILKRKVPRRFPPQSPASVGSNDPGPPETFSAISGDRLSGWRERPLRLGGVPPMVESGPAEAQESHRSLRPMQ